MKVTKSYIKRIIKEELTTVLESANIKQALMQIPISLPAGGIEVTLDISDKSARGSNFQGVDRFDDFLMIAYLVADKSLEPKERYIKLIMKLLSSELGSQVFLDRQDEQIQGRINSIATRMVRDRGLESGMIVRLKDDLKDIASFSMRSMDDYNKLTQAIQEAQK
tara:strand:- start:538 stop:1032 length:495 start_codon:yes stop_codon:yes gene_type:complete